MYNYNFKKNNETLLEEIKDILVEVNEKQEIVNIIITEQNILFFYNLTNNNPLPPHYRLGMLPEYELITAIPINEAKYKYLIDENYTEILIENKKMIIYNTNLKEYIK